MGLAVVDVRRSVAIWMYVKYRNAVRDGFQK